MLTLAIKGLYILLTFAIFMMIICGKLFVFRKRSAQFVSDYCATMAAMIGLYALLSLIFVFIYPDMISKSVMLAIALSPFIIGLLASYHTEKYYTCLQLVLLLFSMYYVIL